MSDHFRALLVGLGQIGAENVEDKVMAVTVPYATHAQTLSDHPSFDWDAALDLSEIACRNVRERWGVPRVGQTLEELGSLDNIDVVVLATPPSYRVPVIEALPNLRAVIVEKPLGRLLSESLDFIRACEERSVVTQVNLTRRADSVMRDLAAGRLTESIGEVQCGFAVYGNGLVNYATHTVDLVRMLLGEITSVQAMPFAGMFLEGPLADDPNLSFSMLLEMGATVTFHPVGFSHYREGSLDLWGDKGRLEIMQEGLLIRQGQLEPCRSLEGAFEVAGDRTEIQPTGYGRALYDLYDDLAAVLAGSKIDTCSPCASAITTERVIHAVLKSSRDGGSEVDIQLS